MCSLPRVSLVALGLLTGLPALAGDVVGTVRFAGAAPVAAPMPVTKDGAACGASAPDETLLVADGKLANAVVIVKGAPTPAPARAAIDQVRCRFVPHVQAVPLGSTLDLANGDAVLHNVHGWQGLRTRFDVPMPGKGQREQAKLAHAGPIQVRCDVHGWMSAWVVVVDAPAAVSGADGAFALRGVPPGTYTVTAWHERLGEQSAQVVVPAQGAARVDFTYR